MSVKGQLLVHWLKEHHQKMRSSHEQQQELLLPYFESVADAPISIDADSVLSRCQQLESERLR